MQYTRNVHGVHACQEVDMLNQPLCALLPRYPALLQPIHVPEKWAVGEGFYILR